MSESINLFNTYDAKQIVIMNKDFTRRTTEAKLQYTFVKIV